MRHRRSRSPKRLTPSDRHFITGLGADARTPGYVIVEVDGARFTSLADEVVESLGLEEGRALSPRQLADLTAAADAEAAYHVAMRLLAARPRAARELTRGLQVRGHGDAACQVALDRLQRNGLVDDDAFARHFVGVRATKGHGPARLSADLQERGVERRLAERVVRETLAAEGIDPHAQLQRLAERRAAQLGELEPRVLRRRLLAYLARRGYSTYHAHEVVDQLVSSSTDE